MELADAEATALEMLDIAPCWSRCGERPSLIHRVTLSITRITRFDMR